MLPILIESLKILILVAMPTCTGFSTQPVSLARNVSENKAPPAHNSVKVEGTAGATTISREGPQVTTTQSIRPFITQMGPGNMSSMHQPLQGGNMVQPPMIPSHSDIAKVVQKLLLPKVPDHPTWTPPSRDYMSKTFTCQTCELPVNEVDSVLMCDACEKGFHLKCLQPAVIRGIHNRVDWHCMSANTGLQGESYAEQIDSKALTSKDTSESETLPKLSEPAKCENLQPAQDSQAGITVSHDNAEISSDRHVSSSLTISNQKESHGGENITSDINHNDLDVPQPNSVGVSGTNTEGGFMMKSKSHFNLLSVDQSQTYAFVIPTHCSFVVFGWFQTFFFCPVWVI
ncbi:RING/FYVE/PHD zinc finger superfamily protein [Trifolium repens]|nr:RING/FYVE/PHD zinc finger superfamily protein [Trifolium repens]